MTTKLSSFSRISETPLAFRTVSRCSSLALFPASHEARLSLWASLNEKIRPSKVKWNATISWKLRFSRTKKRLQTSFNLDCYSSICRRLRWRWWPWKVWRIIVKEKNWSRLNSSASLVQRCLMRLLGKSCKVIQIWHSRYYRKRNRPLRDSKIALSSANYNNCSLRSLSRCEGRLSVSSSFKAPRWGSSETIRASCRNLTLVVPLLCP